MRRLRAVAAFCLLLTAGTLCAESREVLSIYSELMTRAMRQGPAAEAAAFLVHEENGALKCHLWPRSTEDLRQSWFGSIPSGAVAIVHTHPPGYGHMPSRRDREAARMTGLPVVVVSLWDVTAFDPFSGAVRRINSTRRWRAAVGRSTFRCTDPRARR